MKNFFLLFLLFLTPLFGDENIQDMTKELKSYNYWGEFVNMLFTLFFVIILIVLSVWLLKRIMRSRVQNLNRSNGVKILERRPLTQKSSIYLIDILGKGLVISESPAGIHTLCEFPDSVNIQELLEKRLEEQKQSPAESFRQKWGQKMSQLTKRSEGA
jgi:flagellar biosynthetic protein FliO